MSESETKRKIKDISAKIEVEFACKVGAENMKAQLTDPHALAQCEATIRESEKRLEYLNFRLMKLQVEDFKERQVELTPALQVFEATQMQNEEFSASAASLAAPQNSQPITAGYSYSSLPREESSVVASPRLMSEKRKVSTTSSMIQTLFGTLTRQRSSSFTTSRESLVADETALFLVPFDFWQAGIELSPEKIAFKTNEIKHKLQVELKVKTGTERMFQLISNNEEIEKKRLSEVREKLRECSFKVALLKKALQKYRGVDVESEANELEASTASLPNIDVKARKFFTGTIAVKLNFLGNLPGMRSSKSDVYVIIKIDGVQKAKAKSTKQRLSEVLSMKVEKAQELELIAAEPDGSILAIFWTKIWDLEDSIKRRQSYPVDVPLSVQSLPRNLSSDDVHAISKQSLSRGGTLDGVSYVLDMEPAGTVRFQISLQESANLKRRNEGVFRQRLVKKVYPNKGHKFVAMQFYQPMKCAYCTDFLLSGQGYQCQLCRYTCHKGCNELLVTNCITDSGQDQAEEEESTSSATGKIRHSIPHRFEPVTSLSASWCCHCGYLLPFGKKSFLRCTECGTTSHKECKPLVPHFCGLDPQKISKLLKTIEDVERVRKQRAEAASQSASREGSSESLHEKPQPDLPPIPGSGPSAPAEQQTLPDITPVASPVVEQSIQKLIPTNQIKTIPAPKNVGLDDFNFVAVLGKGNFGKVMLAEDRYTQTYYAIKVLKKEFIIENDEVESTRSEKRVFLIANQTRFPFLVNMHSCFQTESRLYFVMEYVSGGDLMWHIQRRQFSPDQARFYACEVLLALEYFHKNDIVYRDLKLDNILLNVDGHIKIADYGLCKENMRYGSTTKTFCGTPEFMAPEIILEKPYTRAVDWWAFGVLIYEMILGKSPFKGDDEDEIFDSVLEDEILYPVNMAKDALLMKEPSKRLGGGRSDAEEVKKHAYFKGVDWKAVYEKRVVPPFIPTVTSSDDFSNFDEEFTREKPRLTPCNTVLSANDQEYFKGFTHVAEWAKASRAQIVVPV